MEGALAINVEVREVMPNLLGQVHDGLDIFEIFTGQADDEVKTQVVDPAIRQDFRSPKDFCLRKAFAHDPAHTLRAGLGGQGDCLLPAGENRVGQ